MGVGDCNNVNDLPKELTRNLPRNPCLPQPPVSIPHGCKEGFVARQTPENVVKDTHDLARAKGSPFFAYSFAVWSF